MAAKGQQGASQTLSLFRFSLALMVVAIHMSGATPPQSGRAAVEAFFCISGFLITMVADGRYAERPAAFLANRFLRIYPTYWLCLILAWIVVSYVPASIALHPSLHAPATAADLAANIGIFGLTQMTDSRLLPAAWSLHTELWFYLIIGLVTATRPRWTFALLGISFIVSGLAVLGFLPFAFYGTPLGNGFAFFIGSAIWQNRHALPAARAWPIAMAGFVLFEALAWVPQAEMSDRIVFLAAPAAGLFLLGLWNTDADFRLGRMSPYCAFAGRLSYPVFLLHWPLGALVWNITGVAPGWGLLGLCLALTLPVAALILIGFEMPLDGLRAWIRKPGAPGETAPGGLPERA
jgi:peptidoglycan/LPS O-acetylase OafA/YrhL